jgi:hypothetical protein
LIDLSFLATVGQSGGGSDLIYLIFFAVVWFLISQDHGGLSCIFGVVVPNRLGVIDWILLFFNVNLLHLLLLPVLLGIPEYYAALVVIIIEALVIKNIPLELFARLKTFFSLPCHPKDHWEDDPIGLLTFFGLGNSVAL